MGHRSAYDEYSYPYYQRGGVSLGGAATGVVVALACAVGLTVWGTALLEAQGYDLHGALRGDFTWASAGVAIGFVTAVFVSYLWGGYAAGRMGAGAGIVNGVLVAVLTLLLVAAAAYLALEVLSIDEVDLPLGIGLLPLDANFTSPGFGVVGAIVLAIFGGAIWGGVNGARWHLRVEADYEDARYQITGTDSFSDLRR
jgi:hypothetical protein